MSQGYCDPIYFSQNFTETPRFLAALASYNGADPAYLRYTNSLWSTSVTVRVEEDTTGDTEGNHTQEEISYLAVGGDATLTAPTATITRTTYTLAGQPIAVEVEGDPNNDGLFYVHTDHLGSINALSTTDGALHGTRTQFVPFGAYFNGGSHDATDRGFTGHQHN